ncbi:CheY-like chemotaxis protein [Paraburkholderia youngii]|uniref:SAV_2336 N-terminal domain-related protein n=1 Tax=Paraburkholderia youngii TaxID=2782701 RepID=UPI003D210E7E
MSLEQFISRLDSARFDVDAGQILDALWLASLGVDLSLHAPDAQHPQETGRPADAPHDARNDADQARGKDSTGRPSQTGSARSKAASGASAASDRSQREPVFARGDFSTSEATINASPVTLPAPRALSNRLQLMRALRPLTERWPAHQYPEIDEESTVEACAQLRAAQFEMILPVFRPRRERWFDVELVLDDDASIELWEDMLREFAQMLRDTGAFGRVRRWRLRMNCAPGHRPYLENAVGLRAPTAYLLGKAARRLVVIASNGATLRWADGSYANVITPWLRDNCVVLLQLTPEERWARSRLGEPHGVVSTTVPGSLTFALNVKTHWWRVSDDLDTEHALPLPVTTLTPAGISQWATMQMARGRSNPAYLLTATTKPNAGGLFAITETMKEEMNVGRAISLLKYESPKAFQLAVYLCTGPFTLAVARLVQAIKFEGNTDPNLLAELLRSGLVIMASPGDANTVRPVAAYFVVHEEARPLLLRSLRNSDASDIARELQRHVSARLAQFTGTGVRSAQLIADENGRHQLPAWATPFAEVAASLLGLPANAETASEQVFDFLNREYPEAVQAVARFAASTMQLTPAAFTSPVWESLLSNRLVYQRSDGAWAFAPHARAALARLVSPRLAPDDGMLVPALSILQSMALAFHVGQITTMKGVRERVRDILSDWVGEKGCALAHWTYMSEYVFAGPFKTALLTGEDPVLDRDSSSVRSIFQSSLDAWSKSASPDSDWPNYASAEVRRIRMAVYLFSRREPAAFRNLTPRPVRDFVERLEKEHSGESLLADQTWREIENRVIAWLPNVADLVAPYCNSFFTRFSNDGFSRLALVPDVFSYLEELLSLWQEATDALFKRRRISTEPLEISFAIAPEHLSMVSAQYPACDIRPRAITSNQLGARDEVLWTVSPSGYITLIGELGKVVKEAMYNLLARWRRQPVVLWVDDKPDNNRQERERGIAEGRFSYVIATSTAAGLALTRTRLFDAVISDMGRPGDAVAAYTLLDALHRDGNRVPFVIYCASRTPAGNDEATSRGAIGLTDNYRELPDLLLKAIIRNEDVLDRPVTAESLRQYTEWRFPGQGSSEKWNARAFADLDLHHYPTLLEVNDAVENAARAVAEYAKVRPRVFTTGTDRVTKSIGFMDAEFRARHDFDAASLKAFQDYSHLIGGPPA